MLDYQQQFIEFALKHQALKFGEFTLKSGRKSPYFFNAGMFNTGEALSLLGNFYAKAIMRENIAYDMIFGPAYKGIPLACATAMSLATVAGQDTPYAFNRKEAKQHGDKGHIVGQALHGNVLIIDDVITAGTAIRESIDIIKEAGAKPAGIIIMLDRQEKGLGEKSAIQEISENFSIPVYSIITLKDLLAFLEHHPLYNVHFPAIEHYREVYGC